MDHGASAIAPTLCALELLCQRELVRPVRCPGCSHDQFRRWGTFAGRQRFRCHRCRRTFSQLTDTPAYYSKRIHLWSRYCECMQACLSLRRAAALLGISLSTAFRWRHAVLNDSRSHDDTTLTGFVELGELHMRHSMKGSRNLHAPARRGARRSDPLFLRVPRVSVVTAWARNARCYSQLVSAPQISANDLRAVLGARLRPPLTIVSDRGAYSSHAVLAGQAGGTFRWTRDRDNADPDIHTRAVQAFQRRILAFLQPFRGVATKYLDNYLRWHRVLETIAAAGSTCGQSNRGG